MRWVSDRAGSRIKSSQFTACVLVVDISTASIRSKFIHCSTSWTAGRKAVEVVNVFVRDVGGRSCATGACAHHAAEFPTGVVVA